MRRVEDLRQLDQPNGRAQELALGALATVEEHPLAPAADQRAREAATRGTTTEARAYLEYLYSKEGQEIVARHYYRPRDPEVAAKYASTFPRINLVTIADFGGWAKAHATHFADGGTFDKIYAR
mgnify:CR=1 FL=1